MSASATILVLEEILDRLTSETSTCGVLDPPPCRKAVYPGFEVAWDVCTACGESDGQLWANLSQIDTRLEGPCQRVTFLAEIGIVRCAAIPKDDGTPPSEERVRQDADQQAADADAIWQLINCCTTDIELLQGIVTVTWRALGPEGGCVGGVWVIRGTYDTCC